jgi:hypothetical protein
VETPEELKAKEAKLLARDNAAKFTADHQAWVFEIADWTAKNLTKEMADLIEDEKKAPSTPSESFGRAGAGVPSASEGPATEPNAVTPIEPAASQTKDPNTAAPAQALAPQTQDPNIAVPDQTAAPKTEDPNTVQTESP